MIPNSFSLGPFTLHIYGLLISLAIIIGWLFAKKRADQYKIKPELLDHSLMLILLILGIIGGRLYHVFDKWDFYKIHQDQIFLLSNGGLGIFGALVGIFVGAWLIAGIMKIRPLSFLDLIAPSVLLGQAVGRFGNYVNQEGFGPPTNLPWGVYIDPDHRLMPYLDSTHFHPTFFYEAILNLIAFLILLKLTPKLVRPGQMFGLYLISYSLIRFIVEFLRIDTARIGVLQIAHVISIGLFCLGVYFLLNKGKKVG